MDVRLATPEELCADLGKRLRAQRLAQALSQDELAARAGISIGALKKLEHTGQAHVTTLMRTVVALGLAGELQGLFLIHPQTSIADMEKAQAGQRQRARRRKTR